VSTKLLAYLNDVKKAPKERAQCAVEAFKTHSLLTNLRYRLAANNGSDPWLPSVRALAADGSPLD